MIQEEAPVPLQQLQLIDSMINKAKNRFYENGHLYLLWGWTILICSAGQYVLQFVLKSSNYWVVWMLTWVVLIYQFFYLRKKRKKQLVKTYTDDIIRYVWVVFTIVLLLTMVTVGRPLAAPHQINAVFLALYGIPTFLSGIILKFRPLMAGAVGCWILNICCLFIPWRYHILLLSLAVIIAWIIPGYLLRIQFKRQNNIIRLS